MSKRTMEVINVKECKLREEVMRRVETIEMTTNTKIEENHINLVERTETVEKTNKDHGERLFILE